MVQDVEALVHCTVRIESILSNGDTQSGTGFFFELFPQGMFSVPVIVTNKHVVAGSVKGLLYFNIKQNDVVARSVKHSPIEIGDFGSLWIGHPDDDVDLAVFLIGPILNQCEREGKKVVNTFITQNNIPDKNLLDSLFTMEDIIMIGYPNGLWDATNNMPIIRKGVTATHPSIDYNGEKNFMIDCACFPGSSGSPVFLFNRSGYTVRGNERLIGGVRVALIGILYAGPQHTASGEIVMQEIPTASRPVSISRIPNNLGLVIKSARLLEFEKEMIERGFQVPAPLQRC